MPSFSRTVNMAVMKQECLLMVVQQIKQHCNDTLHYTVQKMHKIQHALKTNKVMAIQSGCYSYTI